MLLQELLILVALSHPLEPDIHRFCLCPGNIFQQKTSEENLDLLVCAWKWRLDKHPNILFPMVVKNGDESHGIESIKHHQQKTHNWLVLSTHLKHISQKWVHLPQIGHFFLHFRHHRPEARNGRMQSIRLNRVKVWTKTLYSLVKVANQATKLLNHVLRTGIEGVQTAPVPNMCQDHMG